MPQHVRSSLICALFAPRNCAHRGSVAESWPSATMSHCDESFSTVPCHHHGLRLLPPATPFTGPPSWGRSPLPCRTTRLKHIHTFSMSTAPTRCRDSPPPKSLTQQSRSLPPPRPGRRHYLSALAVLASKQLFIALVARVACPSRYASPETRL